MPENKTSFLEGLAELRELALRGADADSKRFSSLARSLLWDVQSRFGITMTPEQMELFKILATSDAGGDYWKGYGDALTAFLLPLLRLGYPGVPVQQRSNQPIPNASLETEDSAEDSNLEHQNPPKKIDSFSLILD